MLVLFDHSVPAPLSPYLTGHTITEARTRGWDTLSNGELLAEAERAGFDVFLTADKNIQYQQNLTGRRIAVVVLSTSQWPLVRLHIEKNAAASTRPRPAAMRKFIFRTSRDAGLRCAALF
jgi:hypothetical protein